MGAMNFRPLFFTLLFKPKSVIRPETSFFLFLCYNSFILTSYFRRRCRAEGLVLGNQISKLYFSVLAVYP